MFGWFNLVLQCNSKSITHRLVSCNIQVLSNMKTFLVSPHYFSECTILEYRWWGETLHFFFNTSSRDIIFKHFLDNCDSTLAEKKRPNILQMRILFAFRRYFILNRFSYVFHAQCVVSLGSFIFMLILRKLLLSPRIVNWKWRYIEGKNNNFYMKIWWISIRVQLFICKWNVLSVLLDIFSNKHFN